jgi:hypothetical protein
MYRRSATEVARASAPPIAQQSSRGWTSPPQVGGPASDGSAAQRAGMLRRAAARSRLLASRRNPVNGVGRCGGGGRPRPRCHWAPPLADRDRLWSRGAHLLRSHGRRWREGRYGFGIDRPGWGIVRSTVGGVAGPSAENGGRRRPHPTHRRGTEVVRSPVTRGTAFAGSTDTDLLAARALPASRSTRRLHAWAEGLGENARQPSGGILRLR